MDYKGESSPRKSGLLRDSNWWPTALYTDAPAI